MIELCMAFGSVVPFLVIGGGILFFALYMNSWHQAAMKEVAEANGLRFHEGGVFGGSCKVEGELDGTRVVIDTYTSGGGKNKSTYTRLRLRDLQVDPSLSVGAEGLFSFIGKAVSGQDYEVGDRAFDDKVLVRGDNPPEVAATFDAVTRKAVYRAVTHKWQLEHGEWSVRRSGRVNDAAQLQRMLDQGMEAARATRRGEGTVTERLEAIVAHDPEPRVRANALKERMTVRPLPSDETLETFARDPGWTGLVAARTLLVERRRPEAVQHLYEALENGDPPGVRIGAAEILSKVDASLVDHARVEAVLLQAVEHEPYIDRAIAGLARIGTVAAVPALLEHADGFLPSARRTAAKKAVRTIQSRVAGADRGQLAIAAAQGGELSEAEVRQRGALAQATRQPEG